MQLGMIGLGRMGGNIVRRLMKNGHTAVVYDKDAKAVSGLATEGATGASTLEEFVAKLEKPRTAWVMLPAGKITEATIDSLAKLMEPGDVILTGTPGGVGYRQSPQRFLKPGERVVVEIDGVGRLENGVAAELVAE